MKCPFKTITTTEKYELVKDHKVVTVEESFTDCLRYDCPFYRYINSSDSLGNEVIYEKCLRR